MNTLYRYLALVIFVAHVGLAVAQEKATVAEREAPAASQPSVDGLTWHDVTTWGAEGRILPDQPRLRWFDRLPSSAQASVTTNVCDLSRDSEDMVVRFISDAPAIHVHYRLTKTNLAMPNMPATRR